MFRAKSIPLVLLFTFIPVPPPKLPIVVSPPSAIVNTHVPLSSAQKIELVLAPFENLAA